LVYHADWGSKEEKRWCATATLGADGCYMCERGGRGHKQACCLFWTLGGNQVGKAAIIGWRDVLAPALRDGGQISLWRFDGSLPSLFVPGNVVVAETYPAECYGWFSEEPLGSKRDSRNRKKSAHRSSAGLMTRR